MTNPEGTLIVSRKDETDLQIRDFYIQVDDQDRIVLRYDRSIKFALPSGPHRIRLINGYTVLEEEFTLEPGQTVKFATSMHYASRMLSAIALILGGAVFSNAKLRREDESLPAEPTGVS